MTERSPGRHAARPAAVVERAGHRAPGLGYRSRCDGADGEDRVSPVMVSNNEEASTVSAPAAPVARRCVWLVLAARRLRGASRSDPHGSWGPWSTTPNPGVPDTTPA